MPSRKGIQLTPPQQNKKNPGACAHSLLRGMPGLVHCLDTPIAVGLADCGDRNSPSIEDWDWPTLTEKAYKDKCTSNREYLSFCLASQARSVTHSWIAWLGLDPFYLLSFFERLLSATANRKPGNRSERTSEAKERQIREGCCSWANSKRYVYTFANISVRPLYSPSHLSFNILSFIKGLTDTLLTGVTLTHALSTAHSTAELYERESFHRVPGLSSE